MKPQETKVFPAIDPAIFRRQMEIFDRMREIEKRFQERAAAAGDRAAARDAGLDRRVSAS